MTKHPKTLGTEAEPVNAERHLSAARADVGDEPVDVLTEEVEALEALLGAPPLPEEAAPTPRSTSSTKAYRRRRSHPTDRGDD